MQAYKIKQLFQRATSLNHNLQLIHLISSSMI